MLHNSGVCLRRDDCGHRLLGVFILIATIIGHRLIEANMDAINQRALAFSKLKQPLVYTTRAVFQPEQSTATQNVFVLHHVTNQTNTFFCRESLPSDSSLLVPAQQPMYVNTATGECIQPSLLERLEFAADNVLPIAFAGGLLLVINFCVFVMGILLMIGCGTTSQ